jgi:hypothetical protein
LDLRHRIAMRISTSTERRQRAEAKATAQRAKALALRQGGRTYAEIGVTLGVSLERARRITCKAERLALDPHWWDDLPVRAMYLLHNRGLIDLPEIEAARALAQLSARELLSTSNFGRVALGALRAWLAGHGFKLRPESPTTWARRPRFAAAKKKLDPPLATAGPISCFEELNICGGARDEIAPTHAKATHAPSDWAQDPRMARRRPPSRAWTHHRRSLLPGPSGSRIPHATRLTGLGPRRKYFV